MQCTRRHRAKPGDARIMFCGSARSRLLLFLGDCVCAVYNINTFSTGNDAGRQFGRRRRSCRSVATIMIIIIIITFHTHTAHERPYVYFAFSVDRAINTRSILYARKSNVRLRVFTVITHSRDSACRTYDGWPTLRVQSRNVSCRTIPRTRID